MQNEKTESVVEEARERFKRAEKAYSASRIQSVEDTKFCLGDSDNGWQWPDEVRKMRQFDKRVCLTVNLTAQHVNNIVNQIRQNRPECRILPVDDYADKKTAEIISGLVRQIQVASAADDAHDVAAEHAAIGGEGYWRIITEYESPSSFNQVIRIKQCPNPNLVYIDPDCKELDKSDAEWGFVFEDVSKERFEIDHPDIDPESWAPDKNKWVTDDTFRIAEYFYLTWADDEALLMQNGESLLASKLPDGVTRDGDTLTHISGESMAIVDKRPTKTKKWKWCKLVGGHDKPVEEKDWAGDYLPIVSIVGKEINVNGEIIRKGLVRDIKDPARMVNYAYSETVQTLALQNKVPYMASAESIEGFESIWQSANLENRAYLPYNAVGDDGQPLQAPMRQPPAVMPQAQVQLLQLSTEEMRAASGQQNANFGVKSEASSGIGIQRLKQQGEIATFHFPDNLARGLRYEGKVIVDLVQKIYDTKRVVRVLGLDGKQKEATLDPNHSQPYAEWDIGEEDIQRIFNPSLGEYDVVIDTGPSFQTQRQEAFAALTDLAGKSPQLMGIAGDLIMKAADFPMAEQLAARLEKALPPNLQEAKGGAAAQAQQAMQQLQQAQQQLQMMQQQMQEMAQKLQVADSGQAKTQAEISAKMQMAELDAYIAYQRMQSDLAAKREQMAIEDKLNRERIELESHLAFIQAQKDAEVKLRAQKLDIESKEEIAELNAYVELKKAGMENAQLSADVSKDLQNDDNQNE